MIAGEAERLARIVNDILWASRFEAEQRSKISIESCDAAQIARRGRAGGQPPRPGGIELVLDLPDDLPRVAADPDKVRQVLGESRRERGQVLARTAGGWTSGSDAAEGMLRFSGGATGASGSPRPSRERIFEKFYRLDPHLTRGVGGTGLGLYICLELVRRMDGPHLGRVARRARARPSSSSCRLELPHA